MSTNFDYTARQLAAEKADTARNEYLDYSTRQILAQEADALRHARGIKVEGPKVGD